MGVGHLTVTTVYRAFKNTGRNMFLQYNKKLNKQGANFHFFPKCGLQG